MATALPDVTDVTSTPLEDVAAEQGDETNSTNSADRPDLTWEQEDITLTNICEDDRLPCIGQFEAVRFEQHGPLVQLSQNLKVLSNQPVLLHSRITKLQARARSIHKDPKGAYYEMGQTLIIPYDYAGWFELVPSDFNRATCYTNIDDVAKAMPSRFFTRSNLKGIRIDGEGEEQKYLERKISAASVLQTNGIFKAKWKTRAETGFFKKKTKEWNTEEVTYLKCIDSDNSEILVPTSHKGKFNAIYERGKLTPNAVYSMKDILGDLSLPIMVRLLFGKTPVVPCIFTGMLIIRDAAVDDALIGSSILNQRNVLFELPLNAPVKMKYTSNDEHFAETEGYKDAKKLTRKYSDLFSMMIRLSPEHDSSQKVLQHIPSDPSVMRGSGEALRVLDLITDISLNSEPKDHLLDPSDSSSQGSYDQQNPIPKGVILMGQSDSDYRSRESQTHV